MKTRSRIALAAGILASGLALGPLVAECLFVPAARGYYSYYAEGGSICFCGKGHRDYFFIENGSFIQLMIAHGYSEELYRLVPASGTEYDLVDSHGAKLGHLKLTRRFMIVETNARSHQVPRVWNRWRIWWEMYAFRNESKTRTSLESLEKYRRARR